MLDLPHVFHHDGRAVAWGAAGEGEPIVLVHGTPFSAQVWRRIAPWLARRRRVYWFDLLGYGASDKTPGADVSLGVQDGVLAALVAHWGLERPEVLAHDFGGATVLRAIVLRGLAVARATLVDPVALAPWGSPFVRHVRAHEAAFAGLPAYVHAALLDAYIAGAAHRSLSEEARAIYRAPWLGPIGQPAFYAQIAQMDEAYTDAIADGLRTLATPVTLLWGEEDAWIPIERGEQLASILPDARLIRVPGAGHLVQEDAPEAIVAAVTDR